MKLVCASAVDKLFVVASYAGAWIETVQHGELMLSVSSRPTRARGLKRESFRETQQSKQVASYAGAWIETALANME